MTVTLSLTQAQEFTALRAFLIGVLPTGTEVLRTQANRVAEPTGPDFVMMTPLHAQRISTNITTFAYLPNNLRTDLGPTKLTVQLDIYGPSAPDNVQIIATLWRSEYATAAFTDAGVDMQPIYADEAHQMAFINGEKQYEDRWSIDLVMQVNPVITTAQDYTTWLDLGLINVDATYPPA